MLVVCWSLIVVRLWLLFDRFCMLLLVVVWLVCVVCCSAYVVHCFSVTCSSAFVACCLWFGCLTVVGFLCALFVVCWFLCVACWCLSCFRLLFIVCYLSVGVCRVSCVVCC